MDAAWAIESENFCSAAGGKKKGASKKTQVVQTSIISNIQ